jgi:hypothetical protein
VIHSPRAFEELKSYKAGPCRDDCRATQICLRNKAEERTPTSSKFNNHADFHIGNYRFQPLLTVWLQVRVLPRPPMKSVVATN